MISWKLEAPKKLVKHEEAPTTLTEGSVKVKVEEVLLSTSDFERYHGEEKCDYPFILGRNAVGVISEVYDKEKSMFQKMDRVVIEPYMPCTYCKECMQGDYDKCSELKYLGQNCDGLLSNFVDVVIDQVHRLPDNISNEEALFVPHVAFCLNVVDSLQLEKGNHVAIFCSTKTGILFAQLAAYYQAVAILVSDNEELLDIAREAGIFYCVNPNEVDVEKEILTITGGRRCRELVLFSDSDFSFKDVYSAAATNAQICLAGSSYRDSRLSLAQISQKHLTIFGVYNGVGNFSSAINLIVTGTVNVERLIGDTINFDNLDEEFANLQEADFALNSKIVKVD